MHNSRTSDLSHISFLAFFKSNLLKRIKTNSCVIYVKNLTVFIILLLKFCIFKSYAATSLLLNTSCAPALLACSFLDILLMDLISLIRNSCS